VKILIKIINHRTDESLALKYISQLVAGMIIALVGMCVFYCVFPTQAMNVIASTQRCLVRQYHRCFTSCDTWKRKLKLIASILRKENIDLDGSREEKGIGLLPV